MKITTTEKDALKAASVAVTAVSKAQELAMIAGVRWDILVLENAKSSVRVSAILNMGAIYITEIVLCVTRRINGELTVSFLAPPNAHSKTTKELTVATLKPQRI